MKEGRKPECPEKTPDDELQKMPHTKARKFKPQPRLEPTLKHWWQARKADVLTVTPRVALLSYFGPRHMDIKYAGHEPQTKFLTDILHLVYLSFVLNSILSKYLNIQSILQQFVFGLVHCFAPKSNSSVIGLALFCVAQMVALAAVPVVGQMESVAFLRP